MIERRIENTQPPYLRPLTAFVQFRRLQKDTQSHPKNPNKIIFEMGATALMAIGLMASTSIENVVIKSVDARTEHSPDCQVIDIVTKQILHKVEVVHFTKYSHKSGILKFLLKTKLAPEYAYPEEVAILCHWLGIQENVNWQRLHQQISSICPNRNFYILVRTEKLKMKYQLVQISPKLVVHEIELLAQ